MPSKKKKKGKPKRLAFTPRPTYHDLSRTPAPKGGLSKGWVLFLTLLGLAAVLAIGSQIKALHDRHQAPIVPVSEVAPQPEPTKDPHIYYTDDAKGRRHYDGVPRLAKKKK